MRADRQGIEEFIEQSERPTVGKILGRFMLNSSVHHGRIEEFFRETTFLPVSADLTEQVKLTDGCWCITVLHDFDLYRTPDSPPSEGGGGYPSPPCGVGGVGVIEKGEMAGCFE